jgi:D-sedoheptulose 7-phosphate isomerase
MAQFDKDAVIDEHFRRSRDALDRAANDPSVRSAIHEISGVVSRCFRAGGKLLIAGNGGSAADAQHIAGEFLSRMNFDRSPLPAIALTADTAVITAVGNDYGFESVFERQIRGLGRPGDVFMAISTSGRSPNVLAALKAARELRLITVGLTGNRDTPMNALCDHRLAAPSSETPVIQQIYLVAAHLFCGLVELELFGASQASSRAARS